MNIMQQNRHMKYEMFEIGTNNKKYVSPYDMEE